MPGDKNPTLNPLLPSDEDLENITGIDSREAARMERAAHAHADDTSAASTPSAGTDLDTAEKRATGSSHTPDSGPTADSPSGSAKAKSRDDLRDKETEGGMFNPSADDSDQASGSGGFLGKMLGGPRRRRFMAAWMISLLTGGGLASAVFGYVSGPLGVVQAGKLLEGFHLDQPADDVDGRVAALARYAFYKKRGIPQNSRMSTLGNIIADRTKLSARFTKAGFEPASTARFHFQAGYVITPKNLSGFEGLTEDIRNDPHKAAAFLRDRLGLEAAPVVRGDGLLYLDTTKMSRKSYMRLVRVIQKAGGASRLAGSLNARFAAKRGMVLPAYRIFKRMTVDKLKTYDQRVVLWNKELKAFVEQDTRPVNPTAINKQTEDDGNGNQNAPPEADDLEDKMKQGIDDAAAANKDDAAKEALKKQIAGKLGPGLVVAAALDIICLFYNVHKNVDINQFYNIVQPAQRIGMMMVGASEAIIDGRDISESGPGSGREQLGFLSDKMVDVAAGDTFFTGKNIMQEQGKAGGVEPPQKLKVGHGKDDPLDKIFVAAIAEPLDKICPVFHSTGVTILMTVATAAVLLSGTGGVLNQIAKALFQGAALAAFAELVTEVLSGSEMDPGALAGAALGNVAAAGTFHAGNQQEISNGGLPLTEKQAIALRNMTNELNHEDFQSKSLAYRLFSPTEPRSFAGQIIQQQNPDPAANVAKYIGSFFNVGHAFASLFGKQLQFATVGAAVEPPDYGVPKFGFADEELTGPIHEDPYINAAHAVALLDAAQAKADHDDEENELVKRAKKCFSVDLVKRETPVYEGKGIADDIPAEPLWSLGPPVEKQVSTYGTIMTGKAADDPDDEYNYNCVDRSDDWTTIRIFILDNQAMNAYFCYIGKASSELTKETCTDTGTPEDPALDAAVLKGEL